MKNFRKILRFSSLLLALAAVAPQIARLSAQSLVSGGLVSSASASGTTSADSAAYDEGVRALHERRWPDAIQIFSRMIDAQSANADAALYWKAYALDKTGKASDSIAVCSTLRKDFSGSRWIEECDALEIEIKVKGDQPAQPNSAHSENALLLSLNSMMHKSKTEALEQIDEILNSDAPDSLKQEALFVLKSNSAESIDEQIVRIRAVEGDVRIHRTDEKKAAAWEQAIAGLELYSGDSLVTVDGRAEIEFEDASMIYLDANSILLFNTLTSVDGAPRTDLALLSGTASFHIRPTIPHENYAIHTPTENLDVHYPRTMNDRLTSYSDASAVKSLNPELDHIAVSTKGNSYPVDDTLYFRDGHVLKLEFPEEADRFNEWDNWVQQRYDARLKNMAEVEHASGLNEALPGFDQLAGKGEFYECVSYGMCWDPAQANGNPLNGGFKSKDSQFQSAEMHSTYDYLNNFPCLNRSSYVIQMQQRFQLNSYDASEQPLPWTWVVCHTGNWIYSHHRRHYVWVPGRTRHHTPPVHWIRSGNTVAFVPKHPKDYASALPLNRHEEVFAFKGKELGPIHIEPGEVISTMKRAPHEFLNAPQPHLKASTEPAMTTRALHDSLTRNSLKSESGAIPVKFDSKHETFLMPTTVHNGAESKTVFTPINNRTGTLQSGNNKGGSHGGVSTGSSGTHGSTGSSGSSGAHASTSATSSSAASSSSSSGGGHH